MNYQKIYEINKNNLKYNEFIMKRGDVESEEKSSGVATNRLSTIEKELIYLLHKKQNI